MAGKVAPCASSVRARNTLAALRNYAGTAISIVVGTATNQRFEGVGEGSIGCAMAKRAGE